MSVLQWLILQNPLAKTLFPALSWPEDAAGRLGRDKAVEPFEGQPLIRRVIERIQPLTGEIVVVVADAARADGLPLEKSERVAVDLYPGGGSLGGIFSGLSAANGQWGLVVACDMPSF